MAIKTFLEFEFKYFLAKNFKFHLKFFIMCYLGKFLILKKLKIFFLLLLIFFLWQSSRIPLSSLQALQQASFSPPQALQALQQLTLSFQALSPHYTFLNQHPSEFPLQACPLQEFPLTGMCQ